MICPVCEHEGRKSTLRGGGTFSTLMAHDCYYDEEGVMHWHDPNTSTTGWMCSNGHRLTQISQSACPAPGCSFRGFNRLEEN